MDSYIVRVYRRLETEPCSVLGIIESVEQQEKHVFRSLDELWAVLNARAAKSGKGGGNGDVDGLLKEMLDGTSAAAPVKFEKKALSGKRKPKAPAGAVRKRRD